MRGKKVIVSLGGGVLIAGAVLAVGAARYVDVIRPNVYFAGMPLAGLTQSEAQTKIDDWWRSRQTVPLTLTNPALTKQPDPATLPAIGVSLDIPGSLAQLKFDDFWDNVKHRVGIDAPPLLEVEPKYKFDINKLDVLRKFVATNGRTPRPAQVVYAGSIQRIPEVAPMALDDGRFKESILRALENGGNGELPIREAKKRVSDEQLESIREVMLTFSTRFPTYKVTRCSNIKLASGKLDGVILMPGERVSFNQTVGRRTIQNGFKIAGVYKNGRHDVDVGGGICQVSSTLYNAALLANLKIVSRSNHSMPVPYVPIGRDATVDYGSIDLVIENNKSHAIAIDSEYAPGKLTFRVLGIKTVGEEVKILSSGHRSWGTGSKTVHDASLSPGKSKVIEKGSAGHAVQTVRIVYLNGKEVERQPLGQSHYRGAVRIIAKNLRAPVASPAAPSGPVPGNPFTAPPPDPSQPEPSGNDGGG